MWGVGSFRDLAVYQRAATFSDALRRAVLSWESFDRWTVGVQHWLDRTRQRELPLPPEAIREAEELGRMLNGLIKVRT